MSGFSPKAASLTSDSGKLNHDIPEGDLHFKAREGSCTLAARIEDHLKNLFGSLARIDRVSARAKSVDRFLGKAAKLQDGKPKYEDPLNQIQDQVGARIVTFYASDVERVRLEIEKYFKYIESQRIVPESEKEFGYEGRHFILFVPEDLIDDTVSGRISGTVRITDKNPLSARMVRSGT